MAIGLALSGGGSRAAAFHCGTLKALQDIGLLSTVEVVSSVSGGSVLAAAWATAITQNKSLQEFIDQMTATLSKGFVVEAIAGLPFSLPPFSRSASLANVFDRKLFRNIRLSELPDRPQFCLNTSVMNNGQVGKFSKDGFRATGITSGQTVFKGADTKLSKAVLCSAGYPLWIPEIRIPTRSLVNCPALIPGDLSKLRTLSFTDGGVLENLGVQTLIKSRTFGASEIISSDSGTVVKTWGKPFRPVTAASRIPGIATIIRLYRVVSLMSKKQDKHMRESLYNALHLKNPTVEKLMMVMIDQSLENFLHNIPKSALMTLSKQSNTPIPSESSVNSIEEFLRKANPNGRSFIVDKALDTYHRDVRSSGESLCNCLGTNFTAISRRSINTLVSHAYWQTLLCYALYW